MKVLSVLSLMSFMVGCFGQGFILGPMQFFQRQANQAFNQAKGMGVQLASMAPAPVQYATQMAMNPMLSAANRFQYQANSAMSDGTGTALGRRKRSIETQGNVREKRQLPWMMIGRQSARPPFQGSSQVAQVGFNSQGASLGTSLLNQASMGQGGFNRPSFNPYQMQGSISSGMDRNRLMRMRRMILMGIRAMHAALDSLEVQMGVTPSTSPQPIFAGGQWGSLGSMGQSGQQQGLVGQMGTQQAIQQNMQQGSMGQQAPASQGVVASTIQQASNLVQGGASVEMSGGRPSRLNGQFGASQGSGTSQNVASSQGLGGPSSSSNLGGGSPFGQSSQGNPQSAGGRRPGTLGFNLFGSPRPDMQNSQSSSSNTMGGMGSNSMSSGMNGGMQGRPSSPSTSSNTAGGRGRRPFNPFGSFGSPSSTSSTPPSTGMGSGMNSDTNSGMNSGWGDATSSSTVSSNSDSGMGTSSTNGGMGDSMGGMNDGMNGMNNDMQNSQTKPPSSNTMGGMDSSNSFGGGMNSDKDRMQSGMNGGMQGDFSSQSTTPDSMGQMGSNDGMSSGSSSSDDQSGSKNPDSSKGSSDSSKGSSDS